MINKIGHDRILSPRGISSLAATVAALLCIQFSLAAALSIQGPDVKPGDFRITTFASGLNYPLGMARLPDGSLLVATSEGTSYWNSNGKLLRLVDADQNGVADGPGTVLYSGLTGGLTSLRIGGTLVFVTGQGSGRRRIAGEGDAVDGHVGSRRIAGLCQAVSRGTLRRHWIIGN